MFAFYNLKSAYYNLTFPFYQLIPILINLNPGFDLNSIRPNIIMPTFGLFKQDRINI